MAQPEMTKKILKAMAGRIGLELSDERLEELMPQMDLNQSASAQLAKIDLEASEPATVFKPFGE